MMLHHLVVIGSLLKAWLGEPLLLVSWGIVVAAVLGAGRVVGLPMLFWHERRREAFWAGLFATFLMAETFFVEFMLDMRASGGGPRRLNLHLGGGGVLWALVVAGGAWRLRPQGAGVAPRPRELVGDGKSLGGHEDLGIRPWPFVAGVLAGGAAVVVRVGVPRGVAVSRGVGDVPALDGGLTKVEKTHMRAQLGSPAIKGKVTAIREWLEQPTRDRIPEQETA